MKNVCSFKTIAVLFLVLFAFMGANKVFASNTGSNTLTHQESKWLNSYLTDESSRPAVRMAFWMDMKLQVDELRKGLPYLVHENVLFTGIQYDGLKTINYTYFTNTTDIDMSNVKSNMVGVLCKDAQTILYLSTFEGTFTYSYFYQGDIANPPFYFISISSTDCNSNGF